MSKKKVIILFSIIAAVIAIGTLGFVFKDNIKSMFFGGKENMQGPEKVIAYIYYDKEKYEDFEKDLKVECENKNWSLLSFDGAKNDSIMISNVETAISRNIDGVVVGHDNLQRLGNITELLKSKNIPVLTIDSKIDGVPMIGPKYKEGGTLLGKELANSSKVKLNGCDFFVILKSKDMTNDERVLVDSAKQEFLKNIDVSSDFVTEQIGGDVSQNTKDLVLDLLENSHDRQKIAILATNGKYAIGAKMAIEQKGMSEKAVVVNMECTKEAIRNYKGEANCWVGSGDYRYSQYGSVAINMLQRLISGNTAINDEFIDVKIIKYENVSELNSIEE